MTDLSPTAEAVFDALNMSELTGPQQYMALAHAAAALRVAADQVVPEEPLYGGDQRWMFERDARQACRKKLLAIADELEA